MPITPKVVSSNPIHGLVYSIQPYVIKFVSDLRQVGGFLWAIQFPSPIKLTATIETEILLKVALNTIKQQTINTFPHSWHITEFGTRVIRRIPLLEQELLTFPEHLITPVYLRFWDGFVFLDLSFSAYCLVYIIVPFSCFFLGIALSALLWFTSFTLCYLETFPTV